MSAAPDFNFEQLLLDVSSQFINLPVETIDAVIEETQRKICQSMGVHLSALWQWSDKDRNLMTITHLYTIPGGPERPTDIDGSIAFPWVYSKMLAGETLVLSNAEMPSESEIDRQSRRSFGVEASVVIPLQAGGQRILGVLTFDILHEAREWREDEVKRLKLVADIFANSLVRKQTVTHLAESEERLSLAAESAEAGIWEFDCETNSFWATDRARRLFGYDSDQIITMDLFESSVHPDDLEVVRQSLFTSFKEGDKLDVEYRITVESGQTRWICSRGRPYFCEDTPVRMLGVSQDISERKQFEEQQTANLKEIETLKQQIEQENYYLRKDLIKVRGFEHIVGESKSFKSVMLAAKQVAPTSATVLLTGETGTGKGVVAHAIHQMSDRSKQPFVTVNCAALPSNLVESELFGREKGAFTGAHAKQVGRFEVANKGTIFLDEIGELPLEIQAKFLRILQEGEFERLGSSSTVSVDVRVITATARNLPADVASGRFRQDLYYRLNVFPITLPPLRDRVEDISLLAQHFTEKYSRKMGKQVDRISKRALKMMRSYSWPGNIRELEHLVERSVIISSGHTLAINNSMLPNFSTVAGKRTLRNLAANERDHIQQVLDQTNWKIEGPDGAAAILDIHPSTLRFRLKKLGVKRPA